MFSQSNYHSWSFVIVTMTTFYFLLWPLLSFHKLEITSPQSLSVHGKQWPVYYSKFQKKDRNSCICATPWGWVDDYRIHHLMKWRYQQQGCRWASQSTTPLATIHTKPETKSPLWSCLWLLLTSQDLPVALLSHLKTEYVCKRASDPHDLSVLERSVKHWYNASTQKTKKPWRPADARMKANGQST